MSGEAENLVQPPPFPTKFQGARWYLRRHFRQYCLFNTAYPVNLNDKRMECILRFFNFEDTIKNDSKLSKMLKIALKKCLENFPKYLRFNTQLALENPEMFTNEFTDFLTLCKEELNKAMVRTLQGIEEPQSSSINITKNRIDAVSCVNEGNTGGNNSPETCVSPSNVVNLDSSLSENVNTNSPTDAIADIIELDDDVITNECNTVTSPAASVLITVPTTDSLPNNTDTVIAQNNKHDLCLKVNMPPNTDDRWLLKRRLQDFVSFGYTPLDKLSDSRTETIISKIFNIELKNTSSLYKHAMRTTAIMYLDKFHLLLPIDHSQLLTDKFDIEYMNIKKLITQTLLGVSAKLEKQLNLLQEKCDEGRAFKDIPNLNELHLRISVKKEKDIHQLLLFNQGNINELRLRTASDGLQFFTAKETYNYPGVAIECRLNNLFFARINKIHCDSVVTLNNREMLVKPNVRVIRETYLNTNTNEKKLAVSTQFLKSHFLIVYETLKKADIPGTDILADVCADFIKDVEFINPHRKAMVINSEAFLSLNNYKYAFSNVVNKNGVKLKHSLNPIVQVKLTRPDESADEPAVFLNFRCLKCSISFNVLSKETPYKSFIQHLKESHNKFNAYIECVNCHNLFEFQDILQRRWAHSC